MTTLINSDSLRMPLADRSVHMICCSPPYWGLRDYGLATWDGGDAGCDHESGRKNQEHTGNIGERNEAGDAFRNSGRYVDQGEATNTCPKCGAIRHDAGLGLEPLHDCNGWATGESCGACYVCRMREWARECWRVLHPTGTLWINLGDSFENKQLCAVPWRVALALQADGWYLRSDIIWAKPNPMPESVTDRPTKAHEYVFLLTKSGRYAYDADAVREAGPGSHPMFAKNGSKSKYHLPEAQWASKSDGRLVLDTNPAGRNRRTVWNIATQPYSGAHFATWPEALVEPMIKAGTSEAGCCPECGKQWERVTERVGTTKRQAMYERGESAYASVNGNALNYAGGHTLPERTVTTFGFRPTCDHEADPVPCTVLDPFAGSGTTGVVARRLGRRFVGLDLSFDYLRDQARRRLALDVLADWHEGNGKAADDDLTGLPLFEAMK